MAAKIIINRASAFRNRARKYRVFIDGKEVGQLKNDSAEEFVVDPGSHVVQCKIDWCSSPEVDVQVTDNGNEYLKVADGMKLYVPFYFLLMIGLLLPLVFQFAKAPMPQWLNAGRLILLLPGLIYILYFLTINKKNYLQIKRDTSNPFSS